ncbi:MAG TPA: hypothetical protein VM287_03545 [Egibacteraceae bacterium]|nr:hypothetical protein [Egibacteraceae bacterium]
MTSGTDERPDFGPGGYLPRRAAQRARKIVLREQMGLGWPIAAVTAAVVLAIVALVFVLTRSGPPGPPFLALASLDQTEAGGVTAVDLPGAPREVLVVRAGGAVRAYEAPGRPVTYCRRSRRLEAPGAVWTLRGRLVGGGRESLRPVPTRIHDGVIYVDPTASMPAPPPAPAGETPVCVS